MPHLRALQHFLIATALVLITATAHATNISGILDTAEIEQLTGLKGIYFKEENVFKVSRPRTDIKIKVDK